MNDKKYNNQQALMLISAIAICIIVAMMGTYEVSLANAGVLSIIGFALLALIALNPDMEAVKAIFNRFTGKQVSSLTEGQLDAATKGIKSAAKYKRIQRGITQGRSAAAYKYKAGKK